MKNMIFLIAILLLALLACTDNNKVLIQMDKNAVAIGETFTARLYVNNSDSTAPAFYIIDGFDTSRIAIDLKDHNCGIFRAAYKTAGEKEIKGYVDFLDRHDTRQSLDFMFKFKVVGIPETEPQGR
jgi:hypothetical protein